MKSAKRLILASWIFTISVEAAMLDAANAQPGTTTYQVMTVRDFVIDGPKLAQRHALVEIDGVYILQGIATLYADYQAVMMARYSPNLGTQPSVSLLTDDASHKARETLVSCDSNPATGQTGCRITIRGQATVCTLTNAFGSARQTPCINVEDGALWSPPPPTKEQIRQAQEAARARDAAQANIPSPPSQSSSPLPKTTVAPPSAQPVQADYAPLLATIRAAGFPCDAVTEVRRTDTYWHVACGQSAYVVADVGGGRLMAQRD